MNKFYCNVEHWDVDINHWDLNKIPIYIEIDY